MFSVESLSRPVVLVCAGIALALAAPAMAGVVIKSSGPSAGQFPVGKKFEDSATITLKAGDTVTVMDTSGSREIKGPGTFRVAARGTSKRSTFAALTRERSNARVSTGTTRNAGNQPTLWMVAVNQSGTFCVANSAALQMWRADTVEPATFEVARDGADTKVAVSFDAKSGVAPWDAAQMPVGEGSTYDIWGAGAAEPAKVTFTMLDAVPDDPATMAEVLIAKGCTAQLDRLAERMM